MGVRWSFATLPNLLAHMLRLIVGIVRNFERIHSEWSQSGVLFHRRPRYYIGHLIFEMLQKVTLTPLPARAREEEQPATPPPITTTRVCIFTNLWSYYLD